ncbi:hypothetical protein BURKHO8Y_210307 [Burkholderia sp. 8Y]|nr:hypothetical protein BURKHO8Y_210307 [Burkholderia sp. 8Y]
MSVRRPTAAWRVKNSATKDAVELPIRQRKLNPIDKRIARCLPAASAASRTHAEYAR